MLKTLTAILLLVALLHSNVANSADSDSLEIKVKAAYLYNFLRFVEWPEDSKLVSNICVLGINKSYHSAFSSLAAISKKSEKIKIDFFNTDDDMKNLSSCQILFITDNASNKSKAVIDYLNSDRDSHVLTIGESNDFINKGGMINFINVKDKIRFEINQDITKAAGLKISSKVLRIAERIIGENS
jgi:hypothetical protein